MSGGLQIRPITTADTDRLIKVRALADNTFRGDSPIEEVDIERTRRYLNQIDAFGFATEVETKIVGFILAMDGRLDDGAGAVIPELCHIAAVFIVPVLWNRKIGSHLLSTLLGAARERSYLRAQLWTQDYNVNAKKLYERHGFAATERTKFDERGDRLVLYNRAL
jgi:GNAT superfamily N-acetyltransferase